MAKKTQTALDNELRAVYIEKVAELFKADGEEVLRTGSSEVAFPVVDSEGNEKFIVVSVKVPKGERKDGYVPYDGYSVAEEYEINQREKAEKKAKADVEKAKKIAKDKAFREKQAELKAKRAEAEGKA
jgi:hypothetical protein